MHLNGTSSFPISFLMNMFGGVPRYSDRGAIQKCRGTQISGPVQAFSKLLSVTQCRFQGLAL